MEKNGKFMPMLTDAETWREIIIWKNLNTHPIFKFLTNRITE